MRNLSILLLLSALFPSLSAQTVALDWVIQIGGIENDLGTAVTVDASGDVYSIGSFGGTVDFDPGMPTLNITTAGETDIYVQKLDAGGNLVWAVTMGGTSFETGRAIAVDAAENVYITGNFSGTADFDPGVGVSNLTSLGLEDIFVCKLDPSGALLWAKQFSGTLGLDIGQGIEVDAAGNVLTVGYFASDIDFDPGVGVFTLTPTFGPDLFISKLNAAGDFVWAKQLGGSNLHFGLDIELDATGNIYTSGHFRETSDFDPGTGVFSMTSGGDQDPFVMKLDAAGDFVWARQFSGTGNDAVQDMAIDAGGNVLATGYFDALADFDPGTGTFDMTPGGSADVFIVKLDNMGDFVWAKQISPTTFASGSSITSDPCGNVYTSGYFVGTADLDPGTGTASLTSAGGSDLFINKLDASGDYIWGLSMGDTGNDEALSIYVDSDENVIATGYFNERVDFDPGTATYLLTSAGGFDAFVLKLDELTTAIPDDLRFLDVSVFPNPTQNKIFINPGSIQEGKLRVWTMEGRMISENRITGQQLEIALPEISGLYFLEIQTDDDGKFWKILKE